ncbi:MAG: penicillin-binding protein activator LpoB [Spirochaetaceae bacterium]|nr:penicillin-binding protein activator LpoB [Spirochaetaceae bacterium]
MEKTRKILIFLLFAVITAGSVHALDTLDEAIRKEAAFIIDRARAGSILAIVNIKSDSARLSEYVMERLPDHLVGNRKGITLVDRSRLDLIQREIDFQYSGEVSDDKMVAIGMKTGAEIIIAGSIIEAGDAYHFSVKMLDVATAHIVGSDSARIEHDSVMNGYLPHSEVARRGKERAELNQARRDSTVRTVQNVLGIFSDGFYLGYLGSLSTPIGLSLGWISGGTSFFVDNEFGPPAFNNYEHSGSMTYSGLAVNNAASGFSYFPSSERTRFEWFCTAGLNINIIKTLLWANLGGGIVYREEYRLFTERASSGAGEGIWLQNADDKVKFVIAAGIYVKLWYFYVQGKYKYIIGEEAGLHDGGLSRLDFGAGYVWRRGN